MAYQDDGKFFVRLYDNEGKERRKINVSELVSIPDESAKPIHGCHSPGITTAMLPDNKVFICAYHRFLRK